MISSILYSQSTFRVASYNVKRFPNVSNVSNVTAAFKTVIGQFNPHILVAVELDGSNAVQKFLSDVMPAGYKASTEVNIIWGTGNECAVFYVDSLFTYLGSSMITADTRPIAEFKFVPKNCSDTLTIFGAHFKAYDYETARRLSAATSLRERTAKMKPSENYIVAGDFNIFTSAEPAFQKLLDQSTPGYFYDPLNAVGNWTNNPDFAYTHSSSPSMLTTRLDMILYSQALKDYGGIDYSQNSFSIFGNDWNHFAKSVIDGRNSWFIDFSVGSAAILASDHLPVFADFSYSVSTGVDQSKEIPNSYSLSQNYPNPFNPETIINYSIPSSGQVKLSIFDLVGREICVLINRFEEAGAHTYNLSASSYSLSSGVYFYQLKSGGSAITKKMVLAK